jgi:hypothetical protein
MTKNLLGWRQYRGKIIPRSAIDQMTNGFRPYETRLKMGDLVRLRVDDLETTQFLPSIVVDVAQSHRSGATYALAFPATLQADFYIVVEGFSGIGMNLNTDESADASGIYTEAEYESYLNNKASPAVLTAERTLRLVSSAVEEATSEQVLIAGAAG